MQNKLKEMSANAKAAAGGVKGLAFVIVVMGVVFGDVAFIWLFQNVFPTGIFRIASYIGVFATTMSVIGLFIGKSKWFRPGAQIIWAWCFAGVEIAITIINTIAAFAVARSGGQVDPTLSMWITFASPATPLVAVIGWFLITWFDEERKRDHKRMEMEDKLHEEELELELATKRAQIRIKHAYLQAGEGFMHEELSAPHIQQQIQQASANEMAATLSNTTGQYIAPRRVQQQPPALPVTQTNQQEVNDRLERVTQELEALRSQTSPKVQAPSSQNGANGHQ